VTAQLPSRPKEISMKATTSIPPEVIGNDQLQPPQSNALEETHHPGSRPNGAPRARLADDAVGEARKSKGANSRTQRLKRKRSTAAKNSTKRTKAKNKPIQKSQRSGTKLAAVVDLLRRKRGATIEEITSATGWQAHSVRGALSGVIK
jgi:hypothetical protein